MRRLSGACGLAFAVVWLAMPTPAAAQGHAQGEALFEAKCASCHSLGSDRTVGPGLQGVTDRRDREWLIEFIVSPDRLISSGDPVAEELLAEYGMPMPNLGVTRSQAEALVDFLATSEEELAEAAVGTESGAESEPTARAGDPAIGRRLFTGRRSLANGGGACISCHSVSGIGLLGGGTLARDLTNVAARYSGSLPQVLETTPFPIMQDIYGARPLTPEEIGHLTTFLEQVNEERTAEARLLGFPVAGLGGMILFLALAAVVWRGRLLGVRKPLIGEER